MNKFFLLTKAFFLAGFSVNRRRNSQKPVFQQLGIFALIFLAASSFYNFMFFFGSMLGPSSEEGGVFGVSGDKETVIYVLSMAAFIAFAGTFSLMQNTLFGGRDFEFLQSLPVKTSTVIAAKITAVMLFVIGEDLLIFVPTALCYLIKTGDVIGALISLVAVFFVSFIPVLISCLLGTLVVLITRHLKNQNIFQVIVYGLYFLLIIAFSFAMRAKGAASSAISNVLPHIKLFAGALRSNDPLQLLLFIGVNLGAFALVVLFVSLLYKPINSIKQKAGDGRYRVSRKANASVSSALFRKDMMMIFTKPSLLINSMMGPVLFTIMGIFVQLIPTASENPEPARSFSVIALVPLFAFMLNSMTNAAAASISLEGRNFELLLSYPLSPANVIRSKIISALVLPSGISLIGSIAVTVIAFLKQNVDAYSIPLIITVLLAPQLSLVYTTIVSVLCNLRWPKIYYEADIQVVKNSKSVLFATLFCMLPSLTIGGVVFILGLLAPIAGLIAAVVIYGVMITVASVILRKKGNKLYIGVVSR